VPRFACVLLVDRSGRILLQERDEHPLIDPEKWGLVGGHLDEGEEFEEAAYRELAEETGIEPGAGELALWRSLTVFHEAYDSHDEVQVWVAATDLGDTDVIVGEGRRIVFVEPETALGLDLTASAAEAVPAFLRSERYRALTGPIDR
jgi:8-oxo-dGTP pyrophosphatase MutT (NUDIX family)